MAVLCAQKRWILANWKKDQRILAMILIEEGNSDKAASKATSLSLESWLELKAVVEEEAGALERKKSDDAVFGAFKMRQAARLKKLKEISEGKSTPAPGEVSCVRVSAEIDLQTLKIGQEIGVYSREPERQEIGISAEVRAMSEEERQAWFEEDRKKYFSLYPGGKSKKSKEKWGRTTAQLRDAEAGESDG